MFPRPCALMFSPSLLAPQGDYKVIGDLEERNDRQVDPLLSPLSVSFSSSASLPSLHFFA